MWVWFEVGVVEFVGSVGVVEESCCGEWDVDVVRFFDWFVVVE